MSPPSEEEQYFLLVEPLNDGATSSQSSPRTRLRFHSSSHPVLVLTADAPKFIRFHTDRTDVENEHGPARIAATSWKPEHAGRWWGFVLNRADGPDASIRGWEEVHMREGQADAAFEWIPISGDESSREELVPVKASGGQGWMTCEWNMGLRQLFWITDELSTELPNFCQRVRVVRERVWGQPGTPEAPAD